MHSGLLFANPIPVEFSIPKVEIDIAIDQAVKEAAEQGYTPFVPRNEEPDWEKLVRKD